MHSNTPPLLLQMRRQCVPHSRIPAAQRGVWTLCRRASARRCVRFTRKRPTHSRRKHTGSVRSPSKHARIPPSGCPSICSLDAGEDSTLEEHLTSERAVLPADDDALSILPPDTEDIPPVPDCLLLPNTRDRRHVPHGSRTIPDPPVDASKSNSKSGLPHCHSRTHTHAGKQASIISLESMPLA